MAYPVTLIPGDGIGPEVVDAAVRVLEATGVQFEWDRQLAGMSAVDKGLDPLPDETIASIERTKLALKGPLTTPVGEGYRSVNVAMRQHFDLYANVRPAHSLPNTGARFTGIDLMLYRENTEGLYSGLEYWDERNGIADSIARVTRTGSERIIRFAFADMQRRGRKKLTIIHKANILKMSSGLFLEVGRRISGENPNVPFEDRIIDNMAMQLVVHPDRYDAMVTTNLFGDILSDLMAGLVGGLGVIGAANVGDDCAVFEAVHGSAPDIAGQGIANPTAVIRAGEMMLQHIGETTAANALTKALEEVYAEGTHFTPDLGGSASTDQFADHLAERVKTIVNG